MFRYEKRHEALISKAAFLRRLGHSFGVVGLLIGFSLGAGMAGYATFEGLSWTDSFLNASMILGGMGPVDKMDDSAAKVFAACYALFSGLFFIAVMSVVIAPWIHRMIHVMHAAEDKAADQE